MEANEPAWFVLKTSTVHVLGGINCWQPYDFSEACTTCGAGAIALPPLIADLNAMGKKDLDFTAHDGQIIVTRRVADALCESQLTGFNIDSVRHHKKLDPDPRFAWLRIRSQWPAMHRNSIFEMGDPCPECGRSGHCASRTHPIALWYPAPPRDAQDFNCTWEYWGIWNAPKKSTPNVGGARLLIVSIRARQFLTQLKIKRLRFEPIHFVNSTAV